MPKALHDVLAREAASKGLTGEDRDRYIYGGLYNAKHSEHGSKTGKPKAKPRPLAPHPGHHVTGSGHRRLK